MNAKILRTKTTVCCSKCEHHPHVLVYHAMHHTMQSQTPILGLIATQTSLHYDLLHSVVDSAYAKLKIFQLCCRIFELPERYREEDIRDVTLHLCLDVSPSAATQRPVFIVFDDLARHLNPPLGLFTKLEKALGSRLEGISAKYSLLSVHLSIQSILRTCIGMSR